MRIDSRAIFKSFEKKTKQNKQKNQRRAEKQFAVGSLEMLKLKLLAILQYMCVKGVTEERERKASQIYGRMAMYSGLPRSQSLKQFSSSWN